MLGRDGDVLSRNSYIYVQNNPLKYVDPTGEIEEGLWLAGFNEWWDNLVVGVGDIVNNLADNYPIIGTALDHPFITGPVMGIVGGVAIYLGATVWEAVATVGPVAVKVQYYILNYKWKDWPNYMIKKGWTFEEIQQTLSKGEWAARSAYNGLNPGNSMNIVTNLSTGKSLIIDIVTNEIIQLGKVGYKF